MVTGPRLALAVGVVIVLVAAACGGGSAPQVTATRAPTPVRPTNGPSAALEPNSGPPGTRITVTGSGWTPRTQVTLTSATLSGAPYATATTGDDGSFVLSFTLEKAPDGSELRVGRFDLVAASASSRVQLPFQVEVRRPVRGPDSGG
jgi:hypothetical protein